MPDVALDPILGQMDAGATSVEFGFTISILEDEKSATGYVYTAMPLMAPDQNDPLEALTSKFSVKNDLLTDQSGENEEEENDEDPKPAEKKPAVKKAAAKK